MPSRAKVKRCAESLQRHFPSVAGHYCFQNQKTFSVQRGPARLARGASHPGCGSQRLLRPLVRASHPAGRGPNSSSLFPPLAAVVAVAPCRGGFGIAENFSSSPEAPLLGELSNEVRLRGCTKTEPFLCRKVRLVASFPVSFWRSLWYTCFAALPAHFIGKGVSTMSPFLSLIQSVAVNIISHCVCKWLDGLSTGRKH